MVLKTPTSFGKQHGYTFCIVKFIMTHMQNSILLVCNPLWVMRHPAELTSLAIPCFKPLARVSECVNEGVLGSPKGSKVRAENIVSYFVV